MLERLHISNYALIDCIDIEFGNGLNIITGETGAGKSIMLGALSLLLGARADSRVIRDAQHKSVVEAIFSLADIDNLKSLFDTNDIEWDAESCILRREIAANGRSRAFINDSPVNISVLKNVALHLIDIHSQNQNLLLATPQFQLDVIDAMASNDLLLSDYRAQFEVLKTAVKKLKSSRMQLKKTAENAEFMRFQLSKLQEGELQGGEEEELVANHDRLSEEIAAKQNLRNALSLLQTGPHNLLNMLDTVDEALRDADSENISVAPLIARLESVRIELDDIAGELSAIESAIDSDPRDLEYLESRLNLISDLKQRFGASSDFELVEKEQEITTQLSMLEDAATIIKDLEESARAAMSVARATATKLTDRRKQAADEFGRKLNSLASPLGMDNLRCEISITPTDLNSRGADKVEFLFAFNKNQELMPVGETASGGELSRLMLCVKAIVSESMHLPTILFDEIDTGVSGKVALKMGELMRRMSRRIQTIVITHLPQVAAKGNNHFKVYKADDDFATHTFIKKLTDQQRVAEIATMLSGNETDKAAMVNAISLLKNSTME